MRYISFLVLFILTYFDLASQNSFSAKLNIPNEVVQGETTVFRLDIIKPEGVRGYTVFTQQFPEGFYVKAKVLKGAEYSYEDNLLTLTWLRIPADSKVSVVYEVSSVIGLTGKFNFSGKLTYLIGNKQGKFALKNYELNVLKEKRIVNDNIIENYAPLIKQTSEIYKDISCIRKQMFNKKKKEYEIELTIKNTKTGSFNIVEKIPTDYSFIEQNSAGAKVTVLRDKIQFYRVTEPGSKDVKIKYNLKPAKGENSLLKLQGKFSFIHNQQIINIPIIEEE